MAELARGRRLIINIDPNFCPSWDLNPEVHDWHASKLTSRPPRTPIYNEQSLESGCFTCYIMFIIVFGRWTKKRRQAVPYAWASCGPSCKQTVSAFIANDHLPHILQFQLVCRLWTSVFSCFLYSLQDLTPNGIGTVGALATTLHFSHHSCWSSSDFKLQCVQRYAAMYAVLAMFIFSYWLMWN